MKVYESGWKWTKQNKNGGKRMEVDESGWKWMKVNESGWKWIKVDASWWKWMKGDASGWNWTKLVGYVKILLLCVLFWCCYFWGRDFDLLGEILAVLFWLYGQLSKCCLFSLINEFFFFFLELIDAKKNFECVNKKTFSVSVLRNHSPLVFIFQVW